MIYLVFNRNLNLKHVAHVQVEISDTEGKQCREWDAAKRLRKMARGWDLLILVLSDLLSSQSEPQHCIP
jgi:hypothetical protein